MWLLIALVVVSVTTKRLILMKMAIVYFGFFRPFVLFLKELNRPLFCLLHVSAPLLLLLRIYFSSLLCSCGVLINKNVMNLKLCCITLLLTSIINYDHLFSFEQISLKHTSVILWIWPITRYRFSCLIWLHEWCKRVGKNTKLNSCWEGKDLEESGK